MVEKRVGWVGGWGEWGNHSLIRRHDPRSSSYLAST